MTGVVEWPEVIFIVGLLVIVAGAVGVFVWRVNAYLIRQRHDMRAHYDQRLIVLQEQFEEKEERLVKRVEQLEHFNAALNVILKQVDDFREEVKDRFDALHRERKDDMKDLHRRLEALMQQKIDRSNEGAMRS